MINKCVECKWLSGSEGKSSLFWLLEDGKWFCLHPDREGGPWNVLQDILGFSRCDRFSQAPQEKIEQRLLAIKTLRERHEKASRASNPRLAKPGAFAKRSLPLGY